MRPLSYLSTAMRRIGQTIERQQVKRTQRFAEATVRSLISDTPVDTSEAASNWQATVDVPAVGTIPPYMPGKGGSTAGSSRLSATVLAVRTINSQYVRNDQTIFITNNTPHIDALNKGHSSQAPAGFIEAAVEEGRGAASVVTLLRQGII